MKFLNNEYLTLITHSDFLCTVNASKIITTDAMKATEMVILWTIIMLSGRLLNSPQIGWQMFVLFSSKKNPLAQTSEPLSGLDMVWLLIGGVSFSDDELLSDELSPPAIILVHYYTTMLCVDLPTHSSIMSGRSLQIGKTPAPRKAAA